MQLPHPHRPAEPFPCAGRAPRACPHSCVRHSYPRQLSHGKVCVPKKRREGMFLTSGGYVSNLPPLCF